MSGIAFLSNWERTDTWIAAGNELARRGHHVFIIVTRDEYANKAKAAGFADDHILLLTRGEAKSASFDHYQSRLCHYEAQSQICVRNFALIDRFMRSESSDWAAHYSRYAFGKILDFIERHDITLMIGQPDNICDLSAEMIMKVKGGRYTAPFEMRLPVKRFMLWDSRIEQRPHITGALTLDDVGDEDVLEAKRIRDLVCGGAKMRHMRTKNEPPSIGFKFLKTVTRGFLYRALIVSRHDVYMYNLRSIFFDLKYHMIPINYYIARLFWNQLFEQPVLGEKFVLYTLNYEPEHSIDVEASHFTSTFETVRNIARSLPLDVKLYVKEHPNALGIRSPQALWRLKNLPGVRLIDPFVDSHLLIQKAELIISLSGTVSLEAALYGKQTAIISDIFIKCFSTCRRIFAPWDVGNALAADPLPYDDVADMRYLAWLISNSHSGTVIEPLVEPDSLGNENISAVASAIEAVFTSSKCATNVTHQSKGKKL